jgi:heme exporter protein CcmD
MNWDALIGMNGHGAYVWSSFGLCVALMAAEVLRLRRRIGIAHATATRSEHDR